jgi:hypothetical protein
MSGLAIAHKLCWTLVRGAVPSTNTAGNEIPVTIGNRIQGQKTLEVTISQSTFDVTNLSQADFASFEFDVKCYSKNYLEAANLADTIYASCPPGDQIFVFEGQNFYIQPLDLFMEYSDRDDYEASVLIRIRNAGE